jgi:hypothetical protein
MEHTEIKGQAYSWKLIFEIENKIKYKIQTNKHKHQHYA